MLKASDEVVILTYLNYRNINKMGFMKYSIFSSLFCYVLNCYDKEYVRRIFIKLVRNGHFKKKQNVKRSYTYEFITFEI